MIARPCNVSARCTPCAESSSPYENLSAEAPDPINYLAMAFRQSIPCENGGCEPDPCTVNCIPPNPNPVCPWCIIHGAGGGSGTTQEKANQNANTTLQQQMSGDQGKPLFGNTAYGGGIPCEGGSTSNYNIPADTYYGETQEEADALAESNFNQLAYANLICITTSSLPGACSDSTDYEQTLAAYGGITEELGHYVWEISAGSLPPGFTLDPVSGLISGDPNTSVPGTYTFTVTVSDDLSNNASKDYEISIISISPAASVLPDATNGTAYSQQLTIDPPSLTGTFSLTGGSFPTGVSIDAAGLISGTPSTGGAFSATISVVIESIGFTCSKTYTLDCWTYTGADSPVLVEDVVADRTSGAITDGIISVFGPGTFQLRFKSAGSGAMIFQESTPNGYAATLGGSLGGCTRSVPIVLRADGSSIGTLQGYTIFDTNSIDAANTCKSSMEALDVLIEFTLSGSKTLTLFWAKSPWPQGLCSATHASFPGGTGIITSLYELA